MKIIFKSKDMKKKKDKKNIVDYDYENIKVIEGVVAEPNKYIFGMHKIEENSNVAWIGYISETNQLFIQYKEMRKTTDGYDIGMREQHFGYFYHDVPVHIFDYLMHAENKGQYINNFIKKNYEFHLEPIMNS